MIRNFITPNPIIPAKYINSAKDYENITTNIQKNKRLNIIDLLS